MKLLDHLKRFSAPNLVHRQLYPPPGIEVRLRPYREEDWGTVLDIHDQNAPGRFPEGHRPHFERFINSSPTSFFVVEAAHVGVVACCGVSAVAENVHILCYGLVSPRYQGMRIGAMMTLARLCFATRTTGIHFSVILTIPKSIGYYQRFGYRQSGQWKADDGKLYPLGTLCYDSKILKPIAETLKRRGHYIDPSLPLPLDPCGEAQVTPNGDGTYALRIEVKPTSTPPAPPTPATTGPANSDR